MGLLTDIVRQKIEQHHQDEETKKARIRGDYWNVINAPNTSDEGRDEAWSNLQKSYNPEAKKKVGTFQQIFQKLRPPQQSAQQPQDSGGSQPAQQPAQSPGTFEEGGIPNDGASAQPVARGPIQPPAQSGVAQQRPSPFMTAEQITQKRMGLEKSEYDAWLERGKQVLGPNADPRDLAEYAGSKGTKLPARPVQGTRQDRKFKLSDGTEVDAQYDPKTGIHYDMNNAPYDVPEGATRMATKAPAKVAWKSGLATVPGSEEPIAVLYDPQNPGVIKDASTGELVPQGAKMLNQTVLAANIRKSYYGEFGKFYQSAKARGLTDEAAKQDAAEKIDKQYNVKIAGQEQNIAINEALSGIGANTGSRAATPPASAPGTLSPTPPKQPPNGAKPKTGAITPGQLSDEDNKNLNTYFGQLFGTSKGASKGSQVRVMAAQAALARLTGMNPMALNAALTEDKATAKALQDAVGVAGAFERVQETLKAHGQVLIDAAKAYGPGNVPLANRTVQWIQENAAAHPELQKYQLALQAVQREYGRLIAGGVQSKAMLPVSASEKGEHVLRKDATLADIKAAVEQLQIEADTEQGAFQKQIAGLRGKLSSGVTGQAAGGNAATPPPANRKPLTEIFK